MPPPERPPATDVFVTNRVELPWGTIVRVLLTIAVLWLVRELWSILLQIIVALFLSAALDPLVTRLQRRGWPRAASVGLIFVAFLGILAGVLLLVMPPLIDQLQRFAANLEDYAQRVEDLLGLDNSFSRQFDFQDGGAPAADDAAGPDAGTVAETTISVGSTVARAISGFFITLVLTVYLLVDGERILDWVLRYLPRRQRVKVRRSMPVISQTVSGYVVGQGLVSLIFGVFAFTVCSLAGVPQPLLLAVIAAFADAIPLAGVIIATIPAGLLALTVSPQAAIVVVGAYLVYQQVENYLIVPRIYRGTLQISSIAVLIAVLVGGELLGILGVLLALPIAAAIPAIERIWREDIAEPGTPASKDGAGPVEYLRGDAAPPGAVPLPVHPGGGASAQARPTNGGGGR
jgi:predicted PurR-regulated permease PerM